MLRTLRLLSSVAVVLLGAHASIAQVTTGTPPFGSFNGSPDIINLANLNAHLTIPVFSRAGRGTPFTYNLQYDSSIWYPVGVSGNQTWTPTQNWGLLSQTAVTTGVLNVSIYSYTCYTYIYLNHTYVMTGQTNQYTWNSYTDAFGVLHPLNAFSQFNWGSCQGINYPPSQNASATAQDGSGYVFTTINYSTPHLTSRDGTVINAPENANGGTGSFTDRNGNQISVSSTGVFTDTLGTTALTVSGSGTPTSPMLLNYSAPGASGTGTGVAVALNYTSYTVATNFGISGIHEFGATAKSLVSSIVLPDGSQYTLNYEATPSTPSPGACTPLAGTYSNNCVTARLASITLPTGGTISFLYYNASSNFSACTTGNNGIFSDGSTSCLKRTTPDGIWTYTRSQVSGTHWQTTINDPTTPTANQTIIDFQGLYETKRVTYQGSSSGQLLQTINTCYNGAASPCTTTSITAAITRRTQLIAYPDNSGKVCEHDQFFNTYGLQTEQDDYDYGNGAPASTPLRKIITVYNTALTNGIVGMPSSITTTDGGGNIKAQTTFAYDETTPTTSSPVSPQWTSISGSRGNATTIRSLVQGSTFLTQTNSYYDTGNVNVTTGVNGAQTTYSYSGTSCGNAFPTSISEPLSTSRSMTWNCTGGVPASSTDENSRVTSSTWNDPYFWRPASVSFPDGGLTSWTYNSQTSVTATKKMNSSQNIVTTQLLDGLGRTSQTQLNSDPPGVDYSAMAYDALGRPYHVYNPTRCNPPTTNCGEPTWGYTTYGYDALSRITSITQQDGSAGSASYTNNTLTATDPAGKKRTSTFDSLGRLTQVTEDPNGLGYPTTYSYDALGDVTGVTQNSSRQRTFVYDALSRLTSETNPESGTVTYGYDASGHSGDLTSRVAPAPNQTGSNTVTTTYAYDLLHRLTQESYSDGTTRTVFFAYDQTSAWGNTLTNTLGRLTERWNGQSCCATAGAEIFSYDPMGRVVLNTQYTPAMSYRPMSYTYDLAGNMTTFTDGVGETYTQTFDAAGRATQLNSSWVDSQHPAVLAATDSSVGYYPFGALRKMNLGNNLTQAYAFNKDLQPCRINANSSASALGTCADAIPSGNLQDFNYGFNLGSSDNWNVMTWTGTGQKTFSRTYGYDSLNRLSTLSSPSDPNGCTGLSWTYDAWGNRTDQTVTGGTCPTFHQTVNTQNRLASSPYQYDAAGNMIADGSHTYTYDAENRLTSVDGGTTASYLYDASGRRVQKAVGSSQTQYIYDLSGNVASELDQNLVWKNAYIHMNGTLVAQYTIGSPRTAFILADHLGSTRLLTDMNQSVVQNLDYLPYGELNSTDTGITTHEFTGDEQDAESDLAHTWFRQYSSSMGRWMTPDPAGLAAVDPANPQSWNRYSYVLNIPLELADRLGLDGVPCTISGAPGICVDVTGQLPGGGGGTGGPFHMWPCSGFVSQQCGPIPPPPNSTINEVRKLAQVLVCTEALPLIINSWAHGGGTTSVGVSGNATLGAPTGGADFGASLMLNGDAWGNVSSTVTTAYNPMGQGILWPSAGANVGGTLTTSTGTTRQITGPSFGGWAAYGPFSAQGSQSANGGPTSGGVTVGPGIGVQVAAANSSNTTQLRSTNCIGAAITLIQWAANLF